MSVSVSMVKYRNSKLNLTARQSVPSYKKQWANVIYLEVTRGNTDYKQW